MPPRVMRRTPAAEEAMKYGYRSFLQDIIGKVVRDTARGLEEPLDLSNKALLEMGLAGVGGVTKLTKAPKAARSLMKLFQREGLKYDTFTEPLPGYGYHQWTFYGEGPLKGATFGTKTTGLGEMKTKVTDMMKKFSKEGK